MASGIAGDGSVQKCGRARCCPAQSAKLLSPDVNTVSRQRTDAKEGTWHKSIKAWNVTVRLACLTCNFTSSSIFTCQTCLQAPYR